MLKFFLSLLISFMVGACAVESLIPRGDMNQKKLTLKYIQSNIKRGSAGDDVVAVLGSPNVVTTSNDGAETWIYDKVWTQVDYADFFATSKHATIIVIKYGLDKKIKDITYRQTLY